MHRAVFQEFERICRERGAGGAVLEVGAIPRRSTLLNLKALEGATEKIGINLEEPQEYGGFRIEKCNSNDMTIFEDSRFDTVLCNSLLEHDPQFWKTIAEIRRVTRPGGLVVLGVPGYRALGLDKVGLFLRRIPVLRRLRRHPFWNFLFCSTLTFLVHDHPGDYYRYSPQAMEEVFLGGMRDVEVNSVMMPPRIIGAGIVT